MSSGAQQTHARIANFRLLVRRHDYDGSCTRTTDVCMPKSVAPARTTNEPVRRNVRARRASRAPRTHIDGTGNAVRCQRETGPSHRPAAHWYQLQLAWWSRETDDGSPSRRGEQHHQPRWNRPDREKTKGGQSEREISGVEDGAGPGCLIQHRQQEADDGGVDTPQRGLNVRPCSERSP